MNSAPCCMFCFMFAYWLFLFTGKEETPTIQTLSGHIALQERSCSFVADPDVRYVLTVGLAKEVPW